MKNTFNPILALSVLVLVLVSSCVTAGDLRAMQANMDDFKGGMITKEVFKAKTDAIVTDVEERSAELLEEAGKIPTGPLELVTYLGTLAVTVFGAKEYTNRVRDGKRKARGEAV